MLITTFTMVPLGTWAWFAEHAPRKVLDSFVHDIVTRTLWESEIMDYMPADDADLPSTVHLNMVIPLIGGNNALRVLPTRIWTSLLRQPNLAFTPLDKMALRRRRRLLKNR